MFRFLPQVSGCPLQTSQRTIQLQTGYSETGATPTVNTNTAPPREVAGSSRGFTTVDMEKRSMFSCELCEVKYARLGGTAGAPGEQEPLGMMEHIQVLNNYDDLTIAFLQEVMMFKVRRSCHAMVEQDIDALKETDYLSRVDMLHCSVCNVYISTSATSVKSHVDSVKHHDNKQLQGDRFSLTFL
ncbi:hypothetical protein CRUP_004672 [Coryphaenoides rupestris]|nr:hypothetical protein CRUP_004672 [Coryphaenoides rupestris]